MVHCGGHLGRVSSKPEPETSSHRAAGQWTTENRAVRKTRMRFVLTNCKSVLAKMLTSALISALPERGKKTSNLATLPAHPPHSNLSVNQ